MRAAAHTTFRSSLEACVYVVILKSFIFAGNTEEALTSPPIQSKVRALVYFSANPLLLYSSIVVYSVCLLFVVALTYVLKPPPHLAFLFTLF